MKMKLIGDKILVKYLPVEEKKIGAILVSEKQEREHKGEVIAVGTVRYINGNKEPFDVTTGDIILMTRKNPIYIDNDLVNDEDRSIKYRIISSDEVIAILGNKNEFKLTSISVTANPEPEYKINKSKKRKK